jgi:hypothetical protein
LRKAQRSFNLDDSDLLSGGPDQAHLGYTDAVVRSRFADAILLCRNPDESVLIRSKEGPTSLAYSQHYPQTSYGSQADSRGNSTR